jgi:MFS family permease
VSRRHRGHGGQQLQRAVGGVRIGQAQGAGGPLLGRLVDRYGQTGVLLTAAALAATAPLGVLLGPAALLGVATPPVGACLRTLLPLSTSSSRCSGDRG